MSRKLSSGRPRAEIIAGYRYGSLAADPPPPPAPEKTPPEKADAPAVDVDTEIDAGIAKLRADLKAIEAAQAADPDAATDPNDKTVSESITAIGAAIDKLEADQKADVAADSPKPDAEKPPAPEVKPPPPAKLAAAQPDMPNSNPVDDEGNVDPSHICHNPDCGHLAAAHSDSGQGKNTGPCTTQGCECPGMQVSNSPTTGDDDGTQDDGSAPEDSSGPDGKSVTAAGAAPVPDDAGTPAPTPPGAGASELNEPPPTEGGENMGPAFTIPVMVIEGQETGDGRTVALEAIEWRIPPMPLMGLATSTHDPAGFDMNDPAVICGRIDTLTRTPGEGGTQLVVGKGFFLSNDDGMYFADLVESMGRLGVSVDVAVEASQVSVGEVDPDGWPTEINEVLTKGTIMGATVCPFPAFEGCYIVLGDGTDGGPPAIPQEKATEPITASTHWMSYEECEPCQSGVDVILASGGPVAPPKSWFEDPNFTADDGRLEEIFDRRGKRAFGGKYACPLTVTPEGRVFGHLAPWGICHTGQSGRCIEAPHSPSGYAHFKRGQHVITAEGEKVRVGNVTAGAGHASTRAGVSASSAMAHYDNTALACADIVCGEDEYGIWVAGALRPDATDEQVRMLRGSSLSGDWRNIGGALELVSALAVNNPGFPQAVVASGHIESLVASGSNVMYRLGHPDVVAEEEHVAGDMPAWALRPVLDLAKAAHRARIERMRA